MTGGGAQRPEPAGAAAMRLAPQPGEVIDRASELRFSWNGRQYPAYRGDTIVSALAAAGERVFSRSLKYHRPRGLLTAGYHDPGCMVQVGDEPNVRGAHRLVSDGMLVSSQNTWPSLRLDAKGVNRLAGRFLTAGFYYKTFMRPRALWPAYEAVLRRFVNAGSVSPDTAPERQEKRYAHPDVLVAGGGPAGMAAAVAAARAGASVLLVEEEHRLGGHLRWGGEADLAALGELTANADGDAAVADLKRAGVEVAAVQDARLGGDVMAAHGRNGVRAVEFAGGTKISCDLLVTAAGWTAPTALLNAAGNRPVYSARAARFLPDMTSLPEDVLVTGGIAGDGGLAELTQHAAATGAEAARRAGRIRRARSLAGPAGTPRTAAAGHGTEPPPVPVPDLPVDPHPELFAARSSGMVDFSEDVSAKDLLSAVAEGYDSVELAKRYTTATMGPLQGKLETVNAVAIVVGATGRSIAETGTTTWRPPYAPVTLGALAGQAHEPVRYSPMQPWHEAHGAAPLVAGAWIRPDGYGNPAAEARNVRERVGII